MYYQNKTKNMNREITISGKSLILMIVIATLLFTSLYVYLLGNSKNEKYTKVPMNKVRVLSVDGDTVTIESLRDGREVAIYKYDKTK